MLQERRAVLLSEWKRKTLEHRAGCPMTPLDPGYHCHNKQSLLACMKAVKGTVSLRTALTGVRELQDFWKDWESNSKVFTISAANTATQIVESISDRSLSHIPKLLYYIICYVM